MLMDDSRKIDGKRVRLRLDALGKSEVWLSKEVGMEQQSINNIVKGKSKRPRKMSEIVRALETTEAYLFGETDDPSPGLDAKALFDDFEGLSFPQRRLVRSLIDTLKSERRGKSPASPRPKGRRKPA